MPRIAPSTAVLLLLLALVALAPWVAPFDRNAMDFAAVLQPPGPGALMGTDQFGRDYALRLLHAGRPALMIAGAVTLLSFALGVPLGLLAALAGGVVDLVVMRLLEIGFAIPPLVFAVAILGVLGPSQTGLVISLAVAFTPLVARITRAAALARNEELFVLAARAAGATPISVALGQILPNIAGTLVTQAALVFSYAILAEASLSFIGLGTSARDPSWGRLLTEAIPLTTIAPWLGLFPGAAIVLVVMLLNIRADSWGGALDPRLRHPG